MTRTTHLGIHFAAALTCCLGIGLVHSTGAGAQALPAPPGDLTIVDFTGDSVTLDGSPASIGVPQQIDTGTHTIAVGTVTSPVSISSGCSVVAVAYRATGPKGPPTVTTTSECPVPRADPDHASIRLGVATAAASTPDGLIAHVDDQDLHATPGAFSGRTDVPPATQTAVTIQLDDQTIRTETVDLISGHAYTLVFGGGGEVPPRLIVVDQGAQTKTAPPAGTTINTGLPGAKQGSSAATNALVAALGIALLVLARRRGRRALLAVAVTLSLTVAGCNRGGSAPDAVGDSGNASPGGATTTTISLPPAPSGGAVVAGDSPSSRSAPTAMTIRSITTRLVPVNTTANLLTDLKDPAAAWYEGTGPSGTGNEVIAGHSSWEGRPGVFAVLTELKLGEIVSVDDSSGTTRYYAVNGAVTRLKTDPWLAAWAAAAKPGLVLISCTGPIDAATGLHADNIWVHATLVETLPGDGPYPHRS